MPPARERHGLPTPPETIEVPMSMTSDRRSFVRQGALLGGGLGLLRAAAGSAEPSSAAGSRNTTLDTIHDLHSTHGNFTDRAVPEDVLRAILQASVRAASASNMQSYSIVIVRDPALVKQVCTYKAPRMLLYCVDYTRTKASAEHLGLPYHADSVVDFVTGSINTALAAQTAVIAARALGVDSLLTNGIHRGDMERVFKLLELPETGCFPLIAVVLGYATEPPRERKGRLSGPGVVHEGKYQRLNRDQLDALVKQHDDPASHLALNDVWRQEGRKHYLEWFFGSWQARAAKPTTSETQMLRLLKRAGFIETQRT
jgi:nitroreductase